MGMVYLFNTQIEKFITSLLRIRKLAWLFCFVCGSMLSPMLVHANTKRIDDPKINLSSPYHTVYTHFLLLNPGNKASAKAGIVFMHGEVYAEKSKEIAIKLKRLLTLHGINVETIPKDPNYIDPMVNENRYVLSRKLPKVYLIKHGEAWRYSKETVAFVRNYKELNRLHTCLYSVLPESFCKKEILNIAIWQYIISICLVIVIWLTHKIMPYFLKLIIHKFIGKANKQSFTAERLLLALVTVYFLRLGLTIFQFESLISFINRLLEATTSFVWMCLAYECINLVQYRIKIAKKHHKFMIHILPLFSIMAKIIVGIIGFIKTIDSLGFETESLVKALSFSTLGLGLACQDTIKNLFGSLMITMDRPFSVGDEIVSGGIRGKVEEVGLRSTLVRTKEGSLVYIPNAKLADAYIDNFGKRTSRMVSLEVPLSYAISFSLLPKFIKGLHTIAQSQPLVKPEKTNIYFDKMGETGFVIIFNFHLETSESSLEYASKNRVIPLVLKLADQLHIRLGKLQYIAHVDHAPSIKSGC